MRSFMIKLDRNKVLESLSIGVLTSFLIKRSIICSSGPVPDIGLDLMILFFITLSLRYILNFSVKGFTRYVKKRVGI